MPLRYVVHAVLAVFFAACAEPADVGRQRLHLTLLDVGPTGLQPTNILAIWNPGLDVTEPYSAYTAEEPEGGRFRIHTGGAAPDNVHRTVESLARVINSTPGGFLHAVPSASIPGAVLLEGRGDSTPPFNVVTTGNGSAWDPPVREERNDVASVRRVGGIVTITFYATHYFEPGEMVKVVHQGSEESLFPAGMKTVLAAPTPEALTYSEPGPDSVALGAIQVVSTDPAPTSTATE